MTTNNQKTVQLKKNISTFSLMMTGVSTIIGSGWLLGTQKIAEIAGPAGLISWVIGACIAMLVAFFYLEIGSAYPSAGGIGYYSHVTHGRLCGFLTSWINWLSIMAVPPIEAQGIIQYLSNLGPKFALLYDPASHFLTLPGIICAIALMIAFMLINYWSVQFFIKFNNFFTILKVFIPIATILFLCYHGLNFQNFTSHPGSFMPYGWSSIFVSVISCGVVMSFNGFQSPLNFSEEIRSPKRMLPVAVIGAILIAFVIYFFLQIVFVGSLSPNMIAVGWQNINFRSPYVDLLMLANMQLLVISVYIGAVISPAACGTTFLASSSRILYSLAAQHHLPKYLTMLHPQYQNPRNAVVTSTLIGCIILFVFKGWYDLVAVISVIHIFSYIPAGVVTLANRYKNPNSLSAGQFSLPFAHLLAPVLLFVLSILLFYAAWPLTIKMLGLLIPGLVFYFYYEFTYYRDNKFMPALKGASWIIIYLAGISLVCYLGNNHNSTHNILDITQSMVCLAVLSLFTYVYGVFFSRLHGETPRHSNR